MNTSSDSESGDSDRGIRYKTNSTRDIQDSPPSYNDKLEDETFGPVLPPKQINKLVGPVLPPYLQKKYLDTENKEHMIAGPEIPPHLKKNSLETDSGRNNKVVGPELPPHLQKSMPDIEDYEEIKIVGRAMLPHLQKNVKFENKEHLVASSSKLQAIGPVPPCLPSVVSESNANIIGPALPPHLQASNNSNQSQNSTETSQTKYVGPALPDHIRQQLSQAAEFQSDDEEEVYGPVPIGFSHSKAHVELEERALQMKIDMLNPQGEKEPAREEWMLELPAAKATTFGLGPRQFRAKEAPDMSDRSSWTDTPEDRAKKKEKKEKAPVDFKKDAELREMKNRDKEQEAIAKKCKRSKESLVDMHSKKKKKDEPESTERRPFSREVDLQVNHFDEARKKAVLKKAQLLDTRFSGGESKFL